MEHFSRKGDKILDPLAGSGMVGIVAQYLHRDFLLGDLNVNGKKVFEALVDFYYQQKNIAQIDNEIFHEFFEKEKK